MPGDLLFAGGVGATAVVPLKAILSDLRKRHDRPGTTKETTMTDLTRRSFLQGVLAGTALVAVPPTLLATPSKRVYRDDLFHESKLTLSHDEYHNCIFSKNVLASTVHVPTKRVFTGCLFEYPVTVLDHDTYYRCHFRQGLADSHADDVTLINNYINNGPGVLRIG